MKIATMAILSVLMVSPAMARNTAIEDSCKASATYRDRKAYYVDQDYYRKCVTEARKRAAEQKSQRLQDEANQATIDYNKTYQRNSEDARRYLRANPPQGN